MDVCPILWDICKGVPLSGNYHGVDHSSTFAGGMGFWVWDVGLGLETYLRRPSCCMFAGSPKTLNPNDLMKAGNAKHPLQSEYSRSYSLFYWNGSSPFKGQKEHQHKPVGGMSLPFEGCKGC